jgi:CrcB protein
LVKRQRAGVGARRVELAPSSGYDPKRSAVRMADGNSSRRSDDAGIGGAGMTYVWVMLGSALGGGLRYFFSGLAANQFGETFPFGTLIVNVTGSFVIGFFATLTGPDGRLIVRSEARQFVMAGICGGYTTFSSFSLQTLNLARGGEMALAGANVGLSVMLCLLAVWAGHLAALWINQLKGA